MKRRGRIKAKSVDRETKTSRKIEEERKGEGCD
jgi:hypothetical protein